MTNKHGVPQSTFRSESPPMLKAVVAFQKVLESDMLATVGSLGFTTLQDLEAAMLVGNVAAPDVERIEALLGDLELTYSTPELLTADEIFARLFGSEFATSFDEQYHEQVDILLAANLLQRSQTGELVIVKKEKPRNPMPLPTLADIKQQALSESWQIEYFREAIRLGYSDLLLVPLALDPTDFLTCSNSEFRSMLVIPQKLEDYVTSFSKGYDTRRSGVDFNALTMGSNYNSHQGNFGWCTKSVVSGNSKFPGWSVLMSKPYSSPPDLYPTWYDLNMSDNFGNHFRLLSMESWSVLLMSELVRLGKSDKPHKFNVMDEVLLGASLNSFSNYNTLIHITNNGFFSSIKLNLVPSDRLDMPLSGRNAYIIA